MKYLLAVAIALLATTAQADDTAAYYSNKGESLVLQKAACDIPGMPNGSRKAVFMAHMTIAPGCWVLAGPETVLVSIPGQGSVQINKWQFKQWEIQ